MSILRQLEPQSFLDVGCGFGRWGFLAREFCDVSRGRVYRKDWLARIDAVEAFPRYIEAWHKAIYSNIYQAAVQDFIEDMDEYDVIFAGDVMEHLQFNDAKVVIRALATKARKAFIIALPLGPSPQGAVYGNLYEQHNSEWSVDVLKQFKPKYIKLYEISATGRQYALAIWTSSVLSGFEAQSDLNCLFVSFDDWANLGHLLSKSLDSVGVRSKAVAFHPHSFYKEQAEICSVKQYQEYAEDANVIVAMHSQYSPVNMTGKRLFVFHGGTIYRNNKSRLNNHFNNRVTGTILQHYEFLENGAKNEQWLLPPVDLSIKPDYGYYDKRFAHYPRHPEVKGSSRILAVVPLIDYSVEIVSYEANLERMSKCDIYIEQLCDHEWGLTALEAAALGKIVITTFRGLKEYNKEYGECELLVANTEDELRQRIEEIMSWSEKQILEKKQATRKWAETYHSFEAVGQRLQRILN